jgi:cytochrome c
MRQTGRASVLLIVFLFESMASFPVPALAESETGARLYGRCLACHSFVRNRTGPKHCGLLGREAGGLTDYRYSAAMKDADVIWTAETLSEFLEAPLEFIPGTKMGYSGVKDPKERAALVEYLVRQSSNPAVCK